MNFIADNFVGALLVVVLVGLYFITYKLNKRVPVPEECRELFDNVTCNGCSNFTCSHKG